MCRRATVLVSSTPFPSAIIPAPSRGRCPASGRVATLLVAFVGLIAFSPAADAQALRPQWRHIGNSAVDLGLAALATGPVGRVWFSADGDTLFARTPSGLLYQTSDFESWRKADPAAIKAPPVQTAAAAGIPAPELGLRTVSSGSLTYGFARFVYKSEDGGQTWSNLTGYRGSSLIGDGLADLAVSPRNSDEVVIANADGVWRTLDSGLSWSGLNETLPNLPIDRIASVPSGSAGLRLILDGSGEAEWSPGEKSAWRLTGGSGLDRDGSLRAAATRALGIEITAIATSASYVYAGGGDGRMWVSSDGGVTWGVPSDRSGARVEAIATDSKDPRIAVAVLGPHTSAVQPRSHVLRTMNGGGFWDDITSNLPDVGTHGVAFDRASGSIYVASEAGLFFTSTDLAAAGRPTPWTPLADGLPHAAARDVRLDSGGNQLYLALAGYGAYAALAPHRSLALHVVSAADLAARAAAPGALLSVLGARLDSATSATLAVPVLNADDAASQIQVPFGVQGTLLPLTLTSATGQVNLSLPLQSVAPAVFVDAEGAPMILDADSGVMLDAGKPAHSNTRVQILVTGLGRVKPDWPTGVAAPLQDPPAVLANVHVFLDGASIEVTRAVLAPGYIGFYLVEAQLPQLVNAGPAELYVEAEGQSSNRVRLYTEP